MQANRLSGNGYCSIFGKQFITNRRGENVSWIGCSVRSILLAVQFRNLRLLVWRLKSSSCHATSNKKEPTYDITIPRLRCLCKPWDASLLQLLPSFPPRALLDSPDLKPQLTAAVLTMIICMPARRMSGFCSTEQGAGLTGKKQARHRELAQYVRATQKPPAGTEATWPVILYAPKNSTAIFAN